MGLSKNNICVLCGWVGRTQMHHIIPRKEDGSEELLNLIELCPNHHAEASENEEDFRKKWGLIGKSKSPKELNDLREFSFLFFNGNFNKEFFDLQAKWNFDRTDVVAYFMGVTRNYVLFNYGNGS